MANTTDFIKWLEDNYGDKECPENDLLNDFKRDREFPDNHASYSILKYLYSVDASDACINTFKKVWDEFRCQN